VLYSFTGGSDGANSSSGLTLGEDGNFYGTTLGGGATFDGTVFKITPGGVLTVLHSFNCTDGFEPVAGLIQQTSDYVLSECGSDNFPTATRAG
jgi:uncharacterized repeat protein (TIGR03803 family)